MPESEIQSKVIDLLENYGLKYLHIGESTYKGRSGSHYKGVPDLMIWSPKDDYNVSMLLEHKGA